MSEVKVNKISPRSGTAVTLGDSGDKFTVPSGSNITINSGASITNDGTATGFDTDTNDKVKVSTNDTTPGFLNGKLVAGTNITLTEGSDGGNETLTVAGAAGGVAGIVSSANATAMTIDSNEQVGIGTGSPSEKLHIETSSGDADVLLHAAEDNSGSDARLFLKTTNTSATPSLFFGDSANDGMGYVKYLNNGNSMQFGTNAAHQWSLDSSGNFLPAATDHGIYLGTTSAAAANLLDDYEEGTFTPAFSFASGSIVHSAQNGVYTKVGRMVNFSAYLHTSGLNSPSGNAEITGLPFAVQGEFGGNVGIMYRWATANLVATLTPRVSGSGIQLFIGNSNVEAAHLQGNDFNGGSVKNVLLISGTYPTT
tara:strand:+ start:1285 stop:2385 length:1101 start_codon:yes stop_codon:yes gene_type:complete